MEDQLKPGKQVRLGYLFKMIENLDKTAATLCFEEHAIFKHLTIGLSLFST